MQAKPSAITKARNHSRDSDRDRQSERQRNAEPPMPIFASLIPAFIEASGRRRW